MYISEGMYLIKGKRFEGMTDEEFFHFCQENETLHFERDEKGNIIVMPPTAFNTGRLNNTISAKLHTWNEQNKLGVTVDSSTGFILPDGSNRSPDAAWVSNEKHNALTEAENKFAPVCPEFIVELRSKSDRLSYLQEKMQMWIGNGVRLGWLIDPIDQKAYIYRKDGSTETIENFNVHLNGEDVLKGFEFDLSLLI